MSATKTHFEQVPLEVARMAAESYGSEFSKFTSQGAQMSLPWLAPLEAAKTETDMEKVHQHVLEAESAIVRRTQEISEFGASDEERQAVDHALKELLAIKTKKLNWPGL